MKDYPFVKCLHPQQIKNKYTGETLIVGCGKCEACNLQKSSSRTLKCKLESMSHRCTYFITLTYNNSSIPLMKPIISNRQGWKYKKKYHFIDMCKRSDTYGSEIISYDFYQSDLDKLYKKTNCYDSLPYLSKRDAQLFIKRLRKHLSKYSNEKIRYYIVGEYGPVHYRPHLHLELWFSSREIEENLHSCLSKSWKFGNIHTEKSVGKSASYIAGYLNSYCSLPGIYKEAFAAPFSCHSQFLGEKILRSEKEEVYKLSPQEFIQRSLCIHGKPTEFSLWWSFKDSYYPRCPRYSTRNHKQRLTSYTTYAAASEIFGKISPLKIAENIIDAIVYKDIRYSVPIVDYFRREYKIHEFIGLSDYVRMTRQIYIELRTSKLFLEFVCNSNNIFEYENQLCMIENFYRHCDYLGLTKQMSDMIDYVDECSDIDELKYFFWNVYYDSDKFQNTRFYKQYREATLNRACDSVKHKILNDKNKIFENI